MPQRKTFIRPIDAILSGADLGAGAIHLIDAGWLAIDGDSVVFGPSCGGVVGLSIEREAIAWVVSGPRGPLRGGRFDAPIAPIGSEPARPEGVRDAVAEGLRAAIRHLPGGRLAAVGVAWPGPVGLDGEPRSFGFDQADFGQPGALGEQRLRPLIREAVAAARSPRASKAGAPVPIDVINDADADLLYEARHGAARGFANAIGVRVGGGLSLAIMHEGRLVRGHTGAAGQIEHIKVRVGSVPLPGEWESVAELDELPPCSCDGRECVARFATGRAIVDQLTSYDVSGLSYSERGRLIERDGDRDLVKAVCGRSGRLLGQALLGIVMALDPDRIVVNAFPQNPHLLRGLRTSLTEGTPIRLEPQDIVAASTAIEATAAGAARLMVEQTIVPRMELELSPTAARVQRRDLPTWLRAQVPPEVDDLDLYSPRYGAPELDLT